MAQITQLERVRYIGNEFSIQYGCFKAFSQYYDIMNGMVPIVISNNHFDIALLNWGHLFGNREDNLHFRNVLESPDEFKDLLLLELNITESEWVKNWKLLKGYRDQRVAHFDPIDKAIVPELDLAFESVCFYHDFVTKKLQNMDATVFITKSLKARFDAEKEYYEQSARAIVEILKV